MALNYAATERLFDLGEFNQLIASADLSPAGLRNLEPRQHALLAHALAQTGDVVRSRRLATLVDQANSSSALRSRAQVILGIISESTGEMSAALEHFQLAIRLASASDDDVQTAWAKLRLFRHLIDRSATNVVMVMLPQVRRAVIRAGNVHVTAYLHQCVAVLEGQVGRIAEARRHCDAIDSLLSTTPNLWLATGNLVNRACLALLECKYGEATKYLTDARFEMVRTGSRASAAETNLGHCQILTGQFDKALGTLKRIGESSRAPHLSVIGSFEGTARVYLALGRLDESESFLNRLDNEIARDPALTRAFHIRWSTITKARLLLKQGRAPEAAEFLRANEQHLSAVDDLPLKSLMHVTAAQALALCGNHEEAARRIVESRRLGITGFRELQAQSYYAFASILTDESNVLRAQLERRARRLWKSQGIVSLPLEMEPGTVGKHLETPKEKERRSTSTASIRIASVVDGLAALFDLAHTPRSMGEELLGVIQAIGCTRDVQLAETPLPEKHDQTKNAELTIPQTITIPLGTDGRQNIAFSCSVASDPENAVVLAGVCAITEAALALERTREAERHRAALWPAETVEEQAGALFISDEMQSLLATARRVAPTTVAVLITGETGTGKEILARTIHAYSNRAKATFVPFNCTSTPKDMLDSQLFGHRRGSFTGATEHFPGLIRAAAGGTLLLDEIGDMPLDMQPKLLRFLESGEVHPIGETQPARADVRVIAATNANLDALVTEGRFREDLYYRLNIVRLHIPPLRERRIEIPALSNHFLQQYAQEYNKGDLRLAEETMEYLLLYRWPGNVRQLANEMRRMAALCETGAVLMPEHLSAEIAATRRTVPASERVLEPTEVVVRLDQPLAAATEHLERAMVQFALTKSGGGMEETAALLGVSRKGLYLKRQRFGIDPPHQDTSADIV